MLHLEVLMIINFFKNLQKILLFYLNNLMKRKIYWKKSQILMFLMFLFNQTFYHELFRLITKPFCKFFIKPNPQFFYLVFQKIPKYIKNFKKQLRFAKEKLYFLLRVMKIVKN